MEAPDQNLALVVRALDLYLAESDSDVESVAAALVSEGVHGPDAVLASCAVLSAFGRVLVGQLGVIVADRFQVKNGSGEWISYCFSSHPIGEAALRVAVAHFVHGPRATFEALSGRSAEVGAVNQALHQGVDVKGARLDTNQFLGVTSEELGGLGLAD